MNPRKFCDELLEVLDIMEKGLQAPLNNINQEHLNYIFAPHKMTIGQIAVHCSAWAEYFMAENESKPWKPVKWTCRPCEYPLTSDFVHMSIKNGFNAIREILKSIDDDGLDILYEKKGPGYIIYRLQLHVLAHANQMAYLRQILEPTWDYGSHFGDMASAYIKLSYHTERDLKIHGF